MIIRLSVPLRQALARLSLPILIAAAFGLMLLGKADTLMIERLRMSVADTLAPVYQVLAEPVSAAHRLAAELRSMIDLRAENARLREENERLRSWQAAALRLEGENTVLRQYVGMIPEPHTGTIAARVVAETGGVYARSVLLFTGGQPGIVKGMVALDERGFVGRISEVGARSARVLLATDINSRIPVLLEGSNSRAMMLGTNGRRPRLAHWPEGVRPQAGQRVVTSSHVGAFPPGLPVGEVVEREGGGFEIELFAQVDRLEFVRLYDFGMRGILPPEVVSRPEPPRRRP